MPGGWLPWRSAVPAVGSAFSTIYVGPGAHSKEEEGLGVAASLIADAVWRLKFRMPPGSQTGLPKLRLTCITSGTGTAVVAPRIATIAMGGNPSTTPLVSLGAQNIVAIQDGYKEFLFPLPSWAVTPSNVLAVDLVFTASGWTLNQTSVWQAEIGWLGGQNVGALPWAPPAQTTPTTINVTAAGTTTLSDSQDAIIQFSRTSQLVLTGAVVINGGRHIRIVGGSIRNTSNGGSGNTPNVLVCTNQKGSVFVEGVELQKNGLWGHGLVVGTTTPTSSTTPDIYVQNCRISGVGGETAQPYSAIRVADKIGTIRIGRVTAQAEWRAFDLTTAWQSTLGQLRPYQAYLTDCNARILATAIDGFNAYWFRDSCNSGVVGGEPYPVTLDNVWAFDESVSNPRPYNAVEMVWPRDTAGSCAALEFPDFDAYWPAGSLVTGVVHTGLPPGGDFVPENAVGLNYFSPGYV